ncbi:bifunctional folylpolyglutamate synthase/dihydrofolate synthase [Orenia marismortui]|uniref:bifunctional folylpolyglutamate synthase/dihydrofolate synthase n=1 Tax=Orenia marismortui TaxID=46469 RepID=UPI00037F48FE|nr:folylpolyglutamate synthase/dihydrofolate synthase family protein [Orenia marismortui]
MKGIKYLESLSKFGVKPGLDRIKLLLSYLDNPEENLNVIHIAGTNGKGSTSAILTSIYKEAGYKVGTYTSPHITEFNERIRVNNENINNEDLGLLVKELKPAINKVADELEHPSFFEVVTALAFLYYYKQDVDMLILEVGLGGRFDATNVVDSLVSVITNVSLDHTDYLGETLEEITFEKAGIIKNQQKVITATKNQAVNDQLLKLSNEKNSKLININDEFDWIEYENNPSYQSFDLIGKDKNYLKLKLPLLGEHQIINTATAIEVIEVLKQKYPLTQENIKKGISKVSWPGRVEVIALKPMVILDGAHNVAGAKSLIKVLEKLNYNNLIIILSILGDKDVDGIVREIVPKADKIILTKNNNYRVMEIDQLKSKVEKYNNNILVKGELKSALEYSLKEADYEDLILISGSLYTVSEARGLLTRE